MSKPPQTNSYQKAIQESRARLEEAKARMVKLSSKLKEHDSLSAWMRKKKQVFDAWSSQAANTAA